MDVQTCLSVPPLSTRGWDPTETPQAEALRRLAFLPVLPWKTRALVRRCGSPAAALESVIEEMRSRVGCERVVANLAPGAPGAGRDRPGRGGSGVRLLLPGEPGWPEILESLGDPPCWLFVRGADLGEADPAIAVVGSRRATSYGIEVARRFVSRFASAGAAIVSGAAVGIDAQAHQTAIESGARTIAVTGCGVDVDYPRANHELRARILDSGGSLVSEFRPGGPPRKEGFLDRNRMIAGLCRATVVVEAAERSGALRTGACAQEASRLLFAVPGNVFSAMSTGANRLLADGAAVAASPEDVLEATGLIASPGKPWRPVWRSGVPTGGPGWAGLPENPAAGAVVACLMPAETLPLPVLAERSGLAPPTLAAALLNLEAAGVVRQSLGGVTLLVQG
ncbi:MAG: DNA-processing protein DprA [Actinomycetota bacterium]